MGFSFPNIWSWPMMTSSKWKHFSCYWSFVRGIHRSQVNSPHNGQWRGASAFSLMCALTNGWANNQDAGDLRRHCAHCYVIVMQCAGLTLTNSHCDTRRKCQEERSNRWGPHRYREYYTVRVGDKWTPSPTPSGKHFISTYDIMSGILIKVI